jgi:hypothetical protein
LRSLYLSGVGPFALTRVLVRKLSEALKATLDELRTLAPLRQP